MLNIRVMMIHFILQALLHPGCQRPQQHTEKLLVSEKDWFFFVHLMFVMYTYIYIHILNRVENSFRSYVMKCHSVSAGCTLLDQSSLNFFMPSEGC